MPEIIYPKMIYGSVTFSRDAVRGDCKDFMKVLHEQYSKDCQDAVLYIENALKRYIKDANRLEE